MLSAAREGEDGRLHDFYAHVLPLRGGECCGRGSPPAGGGASLRAAVALTATRSITASRPPAPVASASIAEYHRRSPPCRLFRGKGGSGAGGRSGVAASAAGGAASAAAVGGAAAVETKKFTFSCNAVEIGDGGPR